MKRYLGYRDEDGVAVYIERDAEQSAFWPLDPPPGVEFDWGPQSAGQRALAREIIADATDDPVLAEAYADQFAVEVLAVLPRMAWSVRADDVQVWCDAQRLVTR